MGEDGTEAGVEPRELSPGAAGPGVNWRGATEDARELRPWSSAGATEGAREPKPRGPASCWKGGTEGALDCARERGCGSSVPLPFVGSMG